MKDIKLARKREVWAVMVSDDRFNSPEMLLDSVHCLVTNPAIDHIYIVDNACTVLVLETLKEYSQNKKANILRIEQRNTIGGCFNYVVAQLQKLQSSPYILLMEPGTILVNDAAGHLSRLIDINQEEVSAAYGNISIDHAFILHQCSFNRERLLQQNCVMLPVMVNADALFETHLNNPQHPFIDSNMDIYWLYDLLIRLTSNSVILHSPNTIATKQLQKTDSNLEQLHLQYLQKKYGQQQVQT